jgi:hypothetical protein
MSKTERFLVKALVTLGLFVIGFVFHAQILGVAK